MLNVLGVIGYILLIIGYILLALIILLAWIIIVPRSVYVEYESEKGITVKIRIFIFKISLYPNKFIAKLMGFDTYDPQEGTNGTEDENDEKSTMELIEKDINLTGQQPPQNIKEQAQSTMSAKKTQQEKTTKQKMDKTQKTEKVSKDYLEGLSQGFQLVKEILAAVKGVFKILLRGIKFKDVCFTLPINGQDAYETQQAYGKMTNAFYVFNTFLQRYVRIYYKNPVFIPDFADIYKNNAYFYCKIQASPSIIIVVGWYLFKTYQKIIKAGKNKTDKIDKER